MPRTIRRKLAFGIGPPYRRDMIHDFHTLAEHDVSWLAIRQPGVMRLLESELASPDNDAFAVGLELACRVLGGRTPLAVLADEGGMAEDNQYYQMYKGRICEPVLRAMWTSRRETVAAVSGSADDEAGVPCAS